MLRPALVICFVAVPGVSLAQQTWQQAADVQPAVEYGAELTAGKTSGQQELKSKVGDSEFSAGPDPKWVWGDDNDKEYTLKTEFSVSGATAAMLTASCDNVGTVFVNGQQVATSSEWQQPMTGNVMKLLVDGKNTITANVANEGAIAGFVLKLAVSTHAQVIEHNSFNG